MANMSASILRNLVASVFNIKATDVILSGEIKPDITFISFTGHSWARGKSIIRIWGFTANEGFKELNVPSYYSDNGTSIGDDPCKLQEIASGEELFFLIHEDHEDQDYNDWESWTLYKAPDFKSHWAKIEQEDIARWEQWLAV